MREPKTGQGSMELAYYREVVERIRDSKTDILINLTTGPGAFFVPSKEDPGKPGPGTNMCSPEVRTRHVTALKPDICSLDLCTMWSRTRAFMNVPEILIEMARHIRAAGVLPVRVDVPRAGVSHQFVKPLVVDQETVVNLRYKRR